VYASEKVYTASETEGDWRFYAIAVVMYELLVFSKVGHDLNVPRVEEKLSGRRSKNIYMECRIPSSA
jgi:hypothetical protein